MAKAFDTVRHDFMNKVYKFYGIGDNMINILNTISTGRTAVILKEDGSTTRQIRLGTGFPQGSPPSPNQFNICEQILLLRFEFDPAIEKIKPLLNGPLPIPVQIPVLMADPVAPVRARDNIPIPVNALNVPVPPPVRPYGTLESNGESGKVEAFADDTTPTGKLTPVAIKAIQNSLSEFAKISGLKCNVEKSQILITGTQNEPIPDYITNSGFEVASKIKILGFELTKNAEDLQNNFLPVLEKIRSLIRFWSRFKLSISGRINVAKSLLLSQISYHGAIIKPNDDLNKTISNEIIKFIIASTCISKQSVCEPAEKGGLGFLDINEFITSLQCSWIKRSAGSSIDCWRQDLNKITGNNPSLVSSDTFDKKRNPILYNISCSFNEFKKAYFMRNYNFLNSNVIGNPLFDT
jgi:hypothetical protein